jgi:hypothetical protein
VQLGKLDVETLRVGGESIGMLFGCVVNDERSMMADRGSGVPALI